MANIECFPLRFDVTQAYLSTVVLFNTTLEILGIIISQKSKGHMRLKIKYKLLIHRQHDYTCRKLLKCTKHPLD